MKALIDGDILRYEIGFGAVTGWKTVTEGREEEPPFDYVEHLLMEKINNITAMAGADSYEIFLTEGRSFRYDIATVKPYKGNRDANTRPFHFNNLTAYIKYNLNNYICEDNLEADDELGIRSKEIHRNRNELVSLDDFSTIVCSRDKDLRQVPGPFFSWELGNQPSFGPLVIDRDGDLTLSDDRKKLNGTGFKWFAAQCLLGDVADNIPGLPRYGPVKVYSILEGLSSSDAIKAVEEEYDSVYNREGYERFLEQARLVWLVRDRGAPLWEPGVYE